MKAIVAPIVAVLTPFSDLGQIDYPVLGAYLSYLEAKGIQAIITNGTTAEFCSLSFDERKGLLEYCRAHFDGTIINHVSSTCISDIRQLLQHSRDFADYALLLPPYYYANTVAQGLHNFFDAVLASTDMPTFLYNFPRHTQINLSADFVSALAGRHRNLVGIKDSSGELENATTYCQVRKPFSTYVGTDRLSLAVLQAGLAGSVTGAGNVFPECLVAIQRYFTEGNDEEALKVQNLFNEWNVWRKDINVDEIALVKCAVAARLKGFPVKTRPPLCSVSDDFSMELVSKLIEFDRKFEEALGLANQED